MDYDLAISHFVGGLSVYKFTSGVGFGTKYTDPATLPGASGRAVAFTKDYTDIILVGTTGAPYVEAYPWTPGVGFGTKYADPATLPAGISVDVSINKITNDIIVAHSNSPFVTAYPWTPGVGFGTKYADPATALAGNCTGVDFSPNGIDVIMSHNNAPRISAYPWSSGFGTKYTNPASIPTANGQAVRFNKIGTKLLFGSTWSARLMAYDWNSGVGFGSIVSPNISPALVSGTPTHVNFDENDSAGAITTTVASTGVRVYAWSNSGGWGSEYTAPFPFPSSQTWTIRWSPNNEDVIINWSDGTPPHTYSWPWDVATGFGTKYADPATPLPSAAFKVAFGLIPTSGFTPSVLPFFLKMSGGMV